MSTVQDNVVRLNVLQGEAKASCDPRLMMTTILGSCVATCLFDPIAKVGGMNHFLLAEPANRDAMQTFDSDFGLFLMEVLINEMLKLGARKDQMKARLYGGAKMNSDLADIGAANAAFARQFLRQERIPLGFEDLEGTSARRVEFRPASGQVRVRHIATDVVVPSHTRNTGARPKADIGSVELF